jgi:pimeloyl-ACP methyl ester carboxylesterase
MIMLSTKQIEIPMPWGYVKGQIFGRIENQTQTPILCLHGYLDNSNSFRPLAKCITSKTSDYFLIAIDLPGQGLSSKIEGDPILFNFKTYILSVRKVVLHLNLKSFIFLTHSFGCTLCMMVI